MIPFEMTRPVTPKGKPEFTCDVCHGPCKLGKVNGGSKFVEEIYEGAKIVMRFCSNDCYEDWLCEDEDSLPAIGAIGPLGNYD